VSDELNEATGAIDNERQARHMPSEQRNFYYAVVAASACSGQVYEVTHSAVYHIRYI